MTDGVPDPLPGGTGRTVAVLADAAGLALSEDRCAELAPLFEAVLAGAQRLRSLDLTGHEPAGPGGGAGG